jgi:hypothetical protein
MKDETAIHNRQVWVGEIGFMSFIIALNRIIRTAAKEYTDEN